MIRIGLLGANGRMGEWVQKLLASEFRERGTLHALASRGDSYVPLFDTDVIIDFSLPEATIALIEASHGKNQPPIVTGATGWNAAQEKTLQTYAETSAVLKAGNFSTGIFALNYILQKAGPLLQQLGYQPHLAEAHHIHKKDAPSGTALQLQKTLNSDQPEKIPTHCIRTGEVVGVHEITFKSPADEIHLGHMAYDRSIFARGAIDAALWLGKTKREFPKTQGMFEMKDFFREHYGMGR